MLRLVLFVNILFSYNNRCLIIRILLSVMKLTKVKQQVFLFTHKELV